MYTRKHKPMSLNGSWLSVKGKAAEHAEEFVLLLGSKEQLALCMMADACDEGYYMTAAFDNEQLVSSEIAMVSMFFFREKEYAIRRRAMHVCEWLYKVGIDASGKADLHPHAQWAYDSERR